MIEVIGITDDCWRECIAAYVAFDLGKELLLQRRDVYGSSSSLSASKIRQLVNLSSTR